jgi:anti-sigma28 factor (negative regulator of flagellin synthesis)
MAAVDRAPETREQVVESLRARVEAGAYSVSGEQVAEMMIRRLIADQVR